MLFPIYAATPAIPWVPSHSRMHISNVKLEPLDVNASNSLDIATKNVAPMLRHFTLQTSSTPPSADDDAIGPDSSKLVNPILLVILVVSVVLVAVLTFIYLIKKHESVQRRQENALDPLTFRPSSSRTSRPPAYEEAVKTSLWPSRPSVCDMLSAPPPSYEEAQRYGTNRMSMEPHSSSSSDITK